MSENVPAPGRQRAPMQIKNLVPGLMEMGKIKIGRKGAARQGQNGTWQLPEKLDHFIVTTMEKGKDNNFIPDSDIHAKIGQAPKSIPVRLLYDDPCLNFPTRYSCYYGKTLYCSGDGEEATRLQKDGTRIPVACPCPRQDPTFAGDDGKGKGKCKINGVLSVIIEGAEVVGGVWKFRTTSYNSVVGILSSMALVRRITGGRLAGIPLTMTVTPKSVADPINGSQQTVYVVGLQYRGTVESLQNVGYQIAMNEAKHGIRVELIEQEARRMLTYEPAGDDPLGADDVDDVVAEFYPEEAAAAAGAEVPAGTGRAGVAGVAGAGRPVDLVPPGTPVDLAPPSEPPLETEPETETETETTVDKNLGKSLAEARRGRREGRKKQEPVAVAAAEQAATVVEPDPEPDPEPEPSHDPEPDFDPDLEPAGNDDPGDLF